MLLPLYLQLIVLSEGVENCFLMKSLLQYCIDLKGLLYI